MMRGIWTGSVAFALVGLYLAASPAAAGGIANCANPENIVQEVVCADPALRNKDQALLTALNAAAKSMDDATRAQIVRELDVVSLELGDSIAHVVQGKSGGWLHAAMDMGRGDRNAPILLVDAALDDQLAIATHLDLRSSAGLDGQWANSESEVRIVDKGGGQYDATFSMALIGWPKSYCSFIAQFETKQGAIVAEKAVSILAVPGLPTGPLTTHIELKRAGATLNAVEDPAASSRGNSSPHTCGHSNVDTRYGAPMFHLTQDVPLKRTRPH